MKIILLFLLASTSYAQIWPFGGSGDAKRIQGKNVVAPLTCDDGDQLTWVAASNRFDCASAVGGGGSEAGTVKLYEAVANGTNFVAWKAADSLGADTTYLIPSTPPSGDQVLQCGTPSGGVSTCTFVTGGGSSAQWHHFIGAGCQNTVGGPGFNTPSSNAPTAACDSGTNTLFGVLQFTEASTQSVQRFFQLPDTFTSAEVELYWRTSATSGDVAWQFQTACLATSEALGNGGSGGPSWNTTQEITSTADGTARDIVRITLTSLTTTGCAANELLLVRISRDPADAQDTIGATAELLSVSFKITP